MESVESLVFNRLLVDRAYHNRLAQTVLSLELQMDSRLHWMHFGLRATHTRRPCQMSWCEN